MAVRANYGTGIIPTLFGAELFVMDEPLNTLQTTRPLGWATHWGMMHAGKIMMRTDSGMNFSPNMYEEFFRPYDQRLLNELGGGAVHFCGRGSHYIASMCSMDRMYAIQLSQPHLNEMETIYRNTVDKGVKLLGFSREYAERTLHEGRNLHGCVHCW
jgi:hypothetical protein